MQMISSNKAVFRGVIKEINPNRGGTSGSITIACRTLNGRPVDDKLYENLRIEADGCNEADGLRRIISEYQKLHETDRKVCFVNYPIINFNKNTVGNEKIASSYHAGDRVEIEGHLASYIRYTRGMGDEVTFIYADSIKPLVSKFEKAYGIPGRIFDEDINDIYTVGMITEMHGRDNTVIDFKIAPDGMDKCYLPFSYYRPTEEFRQKFSVGDHVCVLSTAQSIKVPKVNRAGKRPGRDFHRFTISNIEKVSSGNAECIGDSIHRAELPLCMV